MMKSGLFAMIAAKMAGVPLRFHTFTGQRWVTKKGAFRALLKFMDRRIAANATHVFTDSLSQRSFMHMNHICDKSRVTVLGDGSITGVDIKRFIPNATRRNEIRARCNIGADDIVFIFVGRLSKDKGLVDLMQAFESLKQTMSNIHLIIVGPDEEGLKVELEKCSERLPGAIHILGGTDTPEHYMAASDVLCLPSYREGFGNVVIEAAAVGIPAIASRIYGITDAVEDNITGLLHSAGSVQEIAHAMSIIATDNSLRLKMGLSARERALTKFPLERLTTLLIEFHHLKSRELSFTNT
jgi:glycosyltransferase involved in cell wall biosynthesis